MSKKARSVIEELTDLAEQKYKHYNPQFVDTSVDYSYDNVALIMTGLTPEKDTVILELVGLQDKTDYQLNMELSLIKRDRTETTLAKSEFLQGETLENLLTEFKEALGQ